MTAIARKVDGESNEIWEVIQSSGEKFIVDLRLMGKDMLFDSDGSVIRINESTYKVDYTNKILNEI